MRDSEVLLEFDETLKEYLVGLRIFNSSHEPVVRAVYFTKSELWDLYNKLLVECSGDFNCK